MGFPVQRNLPGELGRIGTATGEEAIFANGCFGSRVAVWSPKTEDRSRFLMDCLALWDCVSWSVNPQVAGSSPARGAMKKPRSKERGFFNDVCLRQMMLASPNDVALLMFMCKHCIIATPGSNLMMQRITSFRPQAIHHYNARSSALFYPNRAFLIAKVVIYPPVAPRSPGRLVSC